MNRYSLIDLYFASSAATPEEVVKAAEAAHIDAVIFVAESADSLPSRESIEALNAAGGPQLHPACVLSGPGYRVAVVLDAWDDADTYDAIEAVGNLALIQSAVADAGGVAIPAGPRQDPDGEVLRTIARLSAEPAVGIVAMVAGGSILGRDLDIEDAGVAGRRVLGGTGPFGGHEDLGRYATLLPADPTRVDDIIRCLVQGFGVCVEQAGPRGGERAPGPTDQPDKKRRRRRRRRGRRGDSEGGPGEAGTSGGEA